MNIKLGIKGPNWSALVQPYELNMLTYKRAISEVHSHRLSHQHLTLSSLCWCWRCWSPTRSLLLLGSGAQVLPVWGQAWGCRGLPGILHTPHCWCCLRSEVQPRVDLDSDSEQGGLWRAIPSSAHHMVSWSFDESSFWWMKAQAEGWESVLMKDPQAL